MKKKLIIGTITIVSLLTACTSNSVKTYPSITIPYEITDKEITEIKDEGHSIYKEYQELKEVKVRELIDEENEEFLKKIENNTSNNLNNDYKVVEFDFGDMTMIYNNRSFHAFDKNSAFIYDDEIVKDKFYKITKYDEKEKLYTTEDPKDRVVYGVDYKNYKIIVLLEKELIKEGLQLKTKIEDETIYIDIK